MADHDQTAAKKILIASANPLFAGGLSSILRQSEEGARLEIFSASSMSETLKRMETWRPDLVIVDYDDRTINRSEFLNHFVSGDWPMQVMLVSLKASGAVVVYDRKTLTPAQAEDWLGLALAEEPNQNKLPSRRNDSMRHFVIVGVLVVVMTVVLSLVMTVANLMPAQASAQAVPVDQVFEIQFVLIAFLFSLITVFMGYSIVVFRAKPGDKSSGKFFKYNNKLEVVWTAVPLVIVLGLAFIGSQTLAETLRIDPQAMEVKVVASQWAWSFEYPKSGVISTELHLPLNKQVLLRMTSKDVIHSFWVPEFRVKQDILPGANLEKTLRITPTMLGPFKVLCAELCGGAHANMVAPVIVESQADFDKWISDQTASVSADPVERGKKISQTSGCISCHSLDGAKTVGPTWKGLAGHVVDLADGSQVTADDAYLKSSILDPNVQLAKGYPANIMPKTYGTSLSDQQINDIIAFIKSLK